MFRLWTGGNPRFNLDLNRLSQTRGRVIHSHVRTPNFQLLCSLTYFGELARRLGCNLETAILASGRIQYHQYILGTFKPNWQTLIDNTRAEPNWPFIFNKNIFSPFMMPLLMMLDIGKKIILVTYIFSNSQYFKYHGLKQKVLDSCLRSLFSVKL